MVPKKETMFDTTKRHDQSLDELNERCDDLADDCLVLDMEMTECAEILDSHQQELKSLAERLDNHAYAIVELQNDNGITGDNFDALVERLNIYHERLLELEKFKRSLSASIFRVT